MSKIILLNGPPSSGKDTAALHIYTQSLAGNTPGKTAIDRMSMPIKKAFAGLMSAPIDHYGNVQPYESTKETIIPSLGVSYRQWQIDFSEKFMKPLYGENIFGRLIIPRIQRRFEKSIANIIVIPDCGFQIEISEIYSAFNPKDILLIRCHRLGFDFSKDSRSYVKAPVSYACVDLINDADVPDFERTITVLVQAWLNDSSSLPVQT